MSKKDSPDQIPCNDCTAVETPAEKRKRLKPCPFCGKKVGNSPLIVREKEYDDRKMLDSRCFRNFWHIVCLCCHAQSDDYATEEEAMEGWNQREIDKRVLAVVLRMYNKAGSMVNTYNGGNSVDEAVFLITRILDGKTDAEITEDINAEQRLRNIT